MSLDLDALLDRLADKVTAKVLGELEPKVAAAVAHALASRVEGQILDIPTLAQRLGKSTDACRMWLKRGGRDLPTVDLGGGRRGVRVDDLEAFLSGVAPRLRVIGGAR